MTARTNTEIYRPFRGKLGGTSLSFLALARSGITAATRKKLPMVILFAPPAIATVIFSFVVYARFSIEAGATPSALGGPSPATAIAAGFVRTMIDVRQQISLFYLAMSLFTLLVIAWFGAGLIAEDRRLGAHLLYFTRPLSTTRYLLGKFLTLFYFAAIVLITPALVICTIAALASPDWAFLKEEGQIVHQSILFGTLWAAVWSSVMLAISSLFERKTFALVTSFAFFVLTTAISVVVANLQEDDRFLMISLQGNFQRIAVWLFDMPRGMGFDSPVGYSFAIVLGATALAWCVLYARVRCMEAAA
jgi:ABC-type transport system involved in multi-copper enzyme maturation permease subunit